MARRQQQPADTPEPEASAPAATGDGPTQGQEGAATRTKLQRTRVAGTYFAIVVAVLVLAFLLVFILQNLTSATVHFLGISGTLPLGLALLFAALAGAVLVALAGTARILQLRREARKISHARR